MPDPSLTNDPSQQSGGFLNQAGASTDWTAPMYGAPTDDNSDPLGSFGDAGALGGMGDLPDLFSQIPGLSSGGASSSTGSLGLLSALLGSGGGGSGGLGMLGLGGIGSSLGTEGSNLLGPLFGLNQSGAGNEGGEIGGGIGSAIGMLFPEFGGPLVGGALGSLFGGLAGNWVGGGVPQMQKPQAFSTGLSDSGNPLEKLLGGYVETQGIQKGYDLSEPAGSNTPFNPDRFANVLEFLSGQNFPQYNGMLNAGGVGLGGIKNLSQLAGSNPTNQTLSMNQIKSIMPELESMVGGYKGKLSGLLPQVNGLAQKLYNAESY